MRVLLTDVIYDAVFTNKNDFFQFGGHAPELVQDSRLSRVGWLAYQSMLSGEMYGEGLYGHTLYGSIVLEAAALTLDFDCGKVVQFDTLGIANHNITNLDVNVSWGSSAGSYPNSVHIGPQTTDSEAVYQVMLTTPASGRYIRVELNNPTESGICRIGRLMLGLNMDLPGYRTVYDSIINSSSIAAFSNTRQLYGARKTTWRKLAFEFAPGDIREVLQSLMQTLDRSTATLWDFDEECMTEDVLYAHIEDSSMDLVNNDAHLFSGRIALGEAK